MLRLQAASILPALHLALKLHLARVDQLSFSKHRSRNQETLQRGFVLPHIAGSLPVDDAAWPPRPKLGNCGSAENWNTGAMMLMWHLCVHMIPNLEVQNASKHKYWLKVFEGVPVSRKRDHPGQFRGILLLQLYQMEICFAISHNNEIFQFRGMTISS